MSTKDTVHSDKVHIIMPVLYVLLSVLVPVLCDTADDNCDGVLTLTTVGGEVVEVREMLEELDMEEVTAVVEGCGCYKLYEEQYQGGKSFVVDRMGSYSIPLAHVGSVALVSCSREAMAPWSLALVVVGVISVTGMLVAVIYKRMGDKHQPGGRPELCQHV